MKLTTTLLGVLAIASGINALPTDDIISVEGRNAPYVGALVEREPVADASPNEAPEDLFKRKGGGGGGGRGSGGSSSGGSSSGGSSSGTGSSGSSGSTGSSGGSTSSGNRGGSTGGTGGTAARPGSGIGPGYGGGRYYGGGAAVPYRSGGRSRGGISPLALGAGAGLAFGLAGLWLYSVYSYNYPDRWNYRNSTTNEDESKPVVCLCEEFSDCGCDPNTDPEYQKQLLGDGSYDNLNKSLITVGDINGTSTIILNGTLPNGTIEAADAGSDGESGAIGINQAMMKGAGYWALTALVGGAVFFV